MMIYIYSGEHEWVDGTECLSNNPDGRCSDLWGDGTSSLPRNDIAEATGASNADCVIASLFNDIHVEIICDGEAGYSWGVLCNAPSN